MKQKFNKWKCKIHNCSSYNFNSLGRHETPWCIIEKFVTVGVIKPKTTGGYNGDLSRKFLKDWTEYCKRKQQWGEDIDKWHDVLKNEFSLDIEEIRKGS